MPWHGRPRCRRCPGSSSRWGFAVWPADVLQPHAPLVIHRLFRVPNLVRGMIRGNVLNLKHATPASWLQNTEPEKTLVMELSKFRPASAPARRPTCNRRRLLSFSQFSGYRLPRTERPGRGSQVTQPSERSTLRASGNICRTEGRHLTRRQHARQLRGLAPGLSRCASSHWGYFYLTSQRSGTSVTRTTAGSERSQNWMPPNGIVGRKGMTDGARPHPKI